MGMAEPVYTVAIAAGRALFASLRVKPKVTGLANLPDAGGAVLAITHFGYLDFALVEWILWHRNRRRIRFLAKKGVFKQPVLGAVLRSMGHIAVDMEAGSEAYAEAVASLKSGEVLGVFPEGGVNASFTVRALKTGTVRMAAEADVPVIPIAVWGGHRLLTKNHRYSVREAVGTPIRFAIGQPFQVDPAVDPRELTLGLHDTLQGLVDGLQGDYPDDGSGQWWQPEPSSG